MYLRALCVAIELRRGYFFVCKCDHISFQKRKSCVPARRERARLTSDWVPLEGFCQPHWDSVFHILQQWSWFHDHFGTLENMLKIGGVHSSRGSVQMSTSQLSRHLSPCAERDEPNDSFGCGRHLRGLVGSPGGAARRTCSALMSPSLISLWACSALCCPTGRYPE